MAGIELLTLQIVDAPRADATVLLDLNDRSPIAVAENGWSAPPPQKQVSSFRSSSRDGSNVAQESFDDRELAIRVVINAVSPDHAAENIQTIGRLLNSEQWLRYQPATIEAVYFRCRPGVIEGIEEFNGQENGLRILSLRIPAEYAAYGEAVTGTATIPNDPTVTDGMHYVFPDIQGDVATPLALQLGGDYNELGLALSCTGGAADASPVYDNTLVLADVHTGWTHTTAADSTAIGGSVSRWDAVTGDVDVSREFYDVEAAPGDWRVFIRIKLTSDDPLLFGLSIDVLGSEYPTPRRLISTTSLGWQWVDGGVLRLPNSGNFSGLPGIVEESGGTAAVMVSIDKGDALDAVRLDTNGLLFIPAGLDDAAVTRLLTAGVADFQAPTTAAKYQLDGIRETAWFGDATEYWNVNVGGAFPVVLPGESNVLSLVRSIHVGIGANNPIDDKTDVTTADWIYYPRYLYIRPATS